jgi:hypothetical protein
MGVIPIVVSVLFSAAPAQAESPPPKDSWPIALPAPKDLAGAVALLERATGAQGEAIETAQGPIPLEEGRSLAMEGKLAARLLAGSHEAFRKAGFYLFRHERSYGLAGEKDRLGILAARDRNAVLRRMGTGSPHRDPTTEKIVAWLDALAKDEPFELTEIGVDYVAGRFERSPKDPAAIARRSAEIAPELVAGRSSTLALLAEEIRVNRTLYLIW